MDVLFLGMKYNIVNHLYSGSWYVARNRENMSSFMFQTLINEEKSFKRQFTVILVWKCFF